MFITRHFLTCSLQQTVQDEVPGIQAGKKKIKPSVAPSLRQRHID